MYTDGSWDEDYKGIGIVINNDGIQIKELLGVPLFKSSLATEGTYVEALSMLHAFSEVSYEHARRRNSHFLH